MPQKIAVIGAGVIGLHSALSLIEEGYEVTIFTDQNPSMTTSMAAGAIWLPLGCEPRDKTMRWAKDGLSTFGYDDKGEIRDFPEAGIKWRNFSEFFDEVCSKPDWMELLPPGIKPICAFPKSFGSIHSVKMPLIDTQKYLPYLLESFLKAGGQIINLHIHKFDQPELLEFPIIINSTGIGAKELASDEAVYPVKGQTVVISQPVDKIAESILYVDKDNSVTLIIPHDDCIVVGVTLVEHDHSPEYDIYAEEKMLARARCFFPKLEESNVISRRVGFRPARMGGIRLEAVMLKSKVIIHSYGHLGGGITLAPGIAKEVKCIVKEVLIDLNPSPTAVKKIIDSSSKDDHCGANISL